jgi:cyanate permease
MHGAAGSWTPPLILLLALLVPQLAFGLAAGRNRVLTAG